jgi:hypothetical protein
MSAGCLMDVSQLACLIQLGEAATAVNKKDFPALIDHDAGAGMRIRRGHSAEETDCRQIMSGFHVRQHTQKDALSCQINVKFRSLTRSPDEAGDRYSILT